MTPVDGTDRSGVQDVLRHLQACDATFQPPLSARIDLAEYSGKLALHATRIEAWRGGDLIGLVAVYCDAPDLGTAFVSNVSVLPERTGQGIARHLMVRAIAHVRALGFNTLALEVHPDAARARQLYTALGFQVTGRSAAGLAKMQRTLT